MDKNLIATQSININTKAKKVWRILTDPEKIKIYFLVQIRRLTGTLAAPSYSKGTIMDIIIKTKELFSKLLKTPFYPIITGVVFQGLKTDPKTIL